MPLENRYDLQQLLLVRMDIPQWHTIWQRNFTRVIPFLDFCQISPSDRLQILSSSPFPINVPERIAKKIEKGSIDDPLFRQFAPLMAEETATAGFDADPLHETTAHCTENILCKYHGRALIITTRACGMHCRFCFRRHYPYCQGPSDFHDELSWLHDHHEIDEVVLSGGDPLAQPTSHLERLLSALGKISHIKRIRLHTRFPIGIPERIDDELLSSLQKIPQQLLVVLHVNHPKELDDEVIVSLSRLRRLGIPLLSQTVLLRGVNDRVEILESLFSTLGNAGIIPYYLHQLDRVLGAAHYEVPVQKGLALVEALRGRMSGYLVPQYVQEVAGRPCKMAVSTAITLS